MPERSALLDLVAVMARLRAECPWKAAQTHRSLARYLLEETHEVLEAIDSGDDDIGGAHLREELGDLLLQVYFHAAIAAEAGEYDVEDVAAELVAKLVRRNPHVFGDATTTDPHRSTRPGSRSSAPRSNARTPPRGCPRRCRRCSTPTR